LDLYVGRWPKEEINAKLILNRFLNVIPPRLAFFCASIEPIPLYQRRPRRSYIRGHSEEKQACHDHDPQKLLQHG